MAKRPERGPSRPERPRPVPRRSARRRLADLVRRTSDGWNRLLEVPAVWIGLLLTVGAWGLTPGGLLPPPEARVGEVAVRDYAAPADLLIPDDETTEEKQRRARLEVPPVYDLDTAALHKLDRDLAALFAAGRQLGRRDAGISVPDLTVALARASGLRVARPQAEALSIEDFGDDLEGRVRAVTGRALRRGVVEGKSRLLEHRVRGITLRDLRTGEERRHFDLFDHLEYPAELREFVESEAEDWRDLSAGQRQEVVALLLANLPANLSSNRSETLERQEAAAAAVAPTFKRIRKGQVIVRQGDQIGPAQARLIAAATGSDRVTGRLLPLVGTMALLGLTALALWPGLARERVAGHSRRRLYGEILLLLLVSILGAKFCFLVSSSLANSFDSAPFDSFRSYAYGVPFAALGLMAALLFSRTAAALLVFVFSILVSRLAGLDALWVTLYAAVGSLGAVYAVQAYQIKQRLTLTRVGLLVGGLNVVTLLVMAALSGGVGTEPLRLLFDLVCGFVGGLLVAAVGSFSIPILETTLGITTDIKLVELANTNLPLLRRLAFEAPGSFQHSLMVANLAKEGCEAIGADPVLAYTGGLYHDVGKALRPDYFVENQRPGQNPHDKLTPSMSALVIIAHVKDGLELAEEHHLPQPVRDAIAQHHGTRLISYFFSRARDQAERREAERKEDVTEEKYRYPGPKPQDKVMGVLMLADGVEAASRTLAEPTELKIRSLVRKIVADCLEDAQLDESDLTLADIKKVSRAFVRVLTNIFHHRIDYPGYDFEAEADRLRESARRERVAGAAARAS
ncbi:MAG TPA: HDIG domain-containing protein [Thermoanaerobaculia bacterium]|nr:HDIG domain-containing protein [Thermoanaerobaculia bacterium]